MGAAQIQLYFTVEHVDVPGAACQWHRTAHTVLTPVAPSNNSTLAFGNFQVSNTGGPRARPHGGRRQLKAVDRARHDRNGVGMLHVRQAEA